ncbi:hypothetical protein BAE44_0000934 [Dichanthelium oligosanthes]|uniref:Uncharacterized protein n=1 Tax=Dichanthelium oligosanthes TaxID=888268 RepID=A0A1E5WKX7_9POAL|nr:hypothetical protein BAE44_0000934 [Dichanthelium oligosanthes]
MGLRGEVAAVASVDGGGSGGNVHNWEQPQGFLGRRPRLASFTRRDGVALTNGQVAVEDGGSKREVPSGPDPIHHGGDGISSAAPATP